jgi:aquaporin Z
MTSDGVVQVPAQAINQHFWIRDVQGATPWLKQLESPTVEARRLLSEVLGTFFLVLVGAGSAVVAAKVNTDMGRAAQVTAPGLMVMGIILFMGRISGAHLNPAVTIGFTIRGDFPWRRVPGYIIAQLAGATIACLFLWAVLGKLGGMGATEPGPGVTNVQAMLFEFILTVGLFSVISGTASSAQNVGPLSAIAVGGYIVLAGLWSSPISGASMNPARSFAPDLINGNFSHYWVYLAGPFAGVVVAAGLAFLLRGRGGDEGGTGAAQGVLIDVSETAPQGAPRSTSETATDASP